MAATSPPPRPPAPRRRREPFAGGSLPVRAGLVFFTLFLSISANLPDNVLTRFGFDPGYLKAALAALVVTGLVVHRRLALIVLVVLLSFGANLPVDSALQLGIERDYLLAALIALVTLPLLLRLF